MHWYYLSHLDNLVFALNIQLLCIKFKENWWDSKDFFKFHLIWLRVKYQGYANFIWNWIYITSFRKYQFVELCCNDCRDCKIDLVYFRDAISKALYQRLFSWLVQRVNTVVRGRDRDNRTTAIALLDIFGFEVMRYFVFWKYSLSLRNNKINSLSK